MDRKSCREPGMPERSPMKLARKATASQLNSRVLIAAVDVVVVATDTPTRRDDECSVRNWPEVCGQQCCTS